MTPEEKASELIEKYYQAIIDIVDVNNAFVYSKQCAIICVEEIIKCKPSFEFFDTSSGLERRPNEDYWNEVLKHLN